MKDNALFVFAHMDDETILSYATIKKFSKTHNITVCTLSGKGRNDNNAFSVKRFKAYENVLNKLNVKFKTFQNNDVSFNYDTIKSEINSVFKTEKPNIVITHSNKDLHYEHRMVFDVVLLNCRLNNNTQSNIHTLISTTSPTTLQTYGYYNNSFKPNYFVKFDEDCMNEKLEFLQSYDMEIPYDDNDIRSVQSIKTWNRMHGFAVNAKYAEPYELIFTTK